MKQCKNLVVLLLLIFMVSIPLSVKAALPPPEITAKSAIIMDAKTGKILYAKEAEVQRYPASTTKMMTLIVALEQGNLDDIVTTSINAAETEGSSLWLSQGEQLRMLDMLYGIMLVSGNDATVAVAERISGSVDKFAKLMTEKAHSIGAYNTNFANSSGLPDPNHYTTAHDLAKIAAYGYKNPMFAKIVSTKNIIVPWPGKEFSRDLYNENRMLWLYEGGNGIKTGYTASAGRCLVSAAKRNDIQLVAVVLDSERMWDDSIALLNYGFSQVQPEVLFNEGDILKTIRVDNGKNDVVTLSTTTNLIVPISMDDKEEFHTVVEAPSKIEAPVMAGQKLGVARAFYKSTEIATVDLVAAQDIERKSFFAILWMNVNKFISFVHDFYV